jgi:hypothetical protein
LVLVVLVVLQELMEPMVEKLLLMPWMLMIHIPRRAEKVEKALRQQQQ